MVDPVPSQEISQIFTKILKICCSLILCYGSNKKSFLSFKIVSRRTRNTPTSFKNSNAPLQYMGNRGVVRTQSNIYEGAFLRV